MKNTFVGRVEHPDTSPARPEMAIIQLLLALKTFHFNPYLTSINISLEFLHPRPRLYIFAPGKVKKNPSTEGMGYDPKQAKAFGNQSMGCDPFWGVK